MLASVVNNQVYDYVRCLQIPCYPRGSTNLGYRVLQDVVWEVRVAIFPDTFSPVRQDDEVLSLIL